jgi:hypothetical protein
MTHTADTEYHHDVPASLTISPPKPDSPRAWPLAARLAVAVLFLALAAVTTMSLITISKVNTRTVQASNLASTEAGQLASMGRQLAAAQAKISAPVKAYRPPAVYRHYGICVSFGRNTANGDLVDVNLTAPSVSAGQYTCGQGSFVSVVPAP